MKKLFKFSVFALLAIFSLISGSAYASVTHTDGDIYGDPYTVETSSGNWTLAGNHTVQGNSTITGNLTVSGTVTETGLIGGGKKNVTLLSSTASTVGTVTIAKSGYVFVLTAPGDSANYIVTLPATGSTASGLFTGETYTFTTATGSTLAIRVPFSTDSTIAYGATGGYNGAGNTLRMTSPASSGSTVTVVGTGRGWVIGSMSTPNTGNSGTTSQWVAGTAA